MPLLKMTDKRQMVNHSDIIHIICTFNIMMISIQELTNPDRKKHLLAALSHIKKFLPTFTAAMQNYVKSPSAASKVSLLSRGSFQGRGNLQLILSWKLEIGEGRGKYTPIIPMKPYHL